MATTSLANVELRDWVRDRVGGTGESVLDESVYSDEELRDDLAVLESLAKEYERELADHRREYRRLLEAGARADGVERSTCAEEARIEKRKYALKKGKLREETRKLGVLLATREIRDVVDACEGADAPHDVAWEESAVRDVKRAVVDGLSEFSFGVAHLREVQAALNVLLPDAEFETGLSDEELVMQWIAATDVSADQIDVEDDLEVNLGRPVDIDPESEIDDLDPAEVDVDVDSSDI